MPIHATDTSNEDYSATYCVEDNKLRLYTDRVHRDTYEFLREHKFVSTPKQECDFVVKWSITAEDIIFRMLADGDDIGDEDTSPQERAVERSDRFAMYRDKRRAEAGTHADSYDAGPSVFGAQNRRRAQSQANRHERHKTRALSQWSKAEYWRGKVDGVIDNALHKSTAHVRRGRIKDLESDVARVAGHIESSNNRYNAWQKVAAADDNSQPIVMADQYNIDTEATNQTGRLAYALAYSSGREFAHPRLPVYHSGDALLQHESDPVTPGELATIWLESTPHPSDPDSRLQRWAAHYDQRLTYERAMVAKMGGSASDIDMEVGGFLGSHQILKLNKSPKTKKIVSVGVWGPNRWGGGEGIQSINIERCGEDVYRAPTDEEREAFKAKLAADKAAKKAAKKTATKKPSLINPTLESAKELQAILNSKESGDESPEVLEMTMATYKINSKGEYGSCKTKEITECLERYNPGYYGGTNQHGQQCVFKVRMNYKRVIVITDKTQKPVPFDLVAEVRATRPTRESMVGRIDWFADASKGISYREDLTDEARQVFDDLRYVGFAYSSTQSDWGLSDEACRIRAASRLQWLIDTFTTTLMDDNAEHKEIHNWRRYARDLGLLKHTESIGRGYPDTNSPLRLTASGETYLANTKQVRGASASTADDATAQANESPADSDDLPTSSDDTNETSDDTQTASDGLLFA